MSEPGHTGISQNTEMEMAFRAATTSQNRVVNGGRMQHQTAFCLFELPRHCVSPTLVRSMASVSISDLK